MIEAETCSALSAVDEPLAGSAAVVRGWVCLEFNAAWGRDVLDGTALGRSLPPSSVDEPTLPMYESCSSVDPAAPIR